MDMGSKYGLMVLATKDNGKTTGLMVMENSYMLMEISMKVTGSTIKPMDSVLTSM